MAYITDTDALGNAIKAERRRQNITQVELAALSGVGVRFLRELEKGKPGCQIGRAISVMSALGIKLDVITRES